MLISMVMILQTNFSTQLGFRSCLLKVQFDSKMRVQHLLLTLFKQACQIVSFQSADFLLNRCVEGLAFKN